MKLMSGLVVCVKLVCDMVFVVCAAVCSRVLMFGNVRHTSEIDLKAKLAQFGRSSVTVSH